MSLYHKYLPTQIFTGSEMLPQGNVLITTDDGKIDAIVPNEEAGDDVQTVEGILSPGWVNAHCHLELSHMKGMIAEHTGLVDFVLSIMAKRTADADYLQQCIADAYDEMWRQGIAAVGDICNTADTVNIKIERKDIYFKNFIEVSGFVGNVAWKRMEAIGEVQKLFLKNGLNANIVPHSPYSVSENLFRLINKNSVGEIISIHNQEIAAEDELYLTKSGDFLRLYKTLGINLDGFSPTGKRSLSSWLPFFNQQQQIISVHNSFTNEADLHQDISRLHFCLCPNANLYIENRLPNVLLLMQYTDKIIIGTDSLASNHQLSILAEINTLQQHFPTVELSTLLKWATQNGAKALGIADKYGTFEKGKQPGGVVIKDGTSSKLF